MSFNQQQGRFAGEEELLELRERVRELEAALEVKEQMEKQIQQEYHGNLEKIRLELAEKKESGERVQGLEREN